MRIRSSCSVCDFTVTLYFDTDFFRRKLGVKLVNGCNASESNTLSPLAAIGVAPTSSNLVLNLCRANLAFALCNLVAARKGAALAPGPTSLCICRFVGPQLPHLAKEGSAQQGLDIL
jgi:hypothetical protein